MTERSPLLRALRVPWLEYGLVLSTRTGAPTDGTAVRILRDLGDTSSGPALVAHWAGGEAVVAELGD